jgi:hypothetical protein
MTVGDVLNNFILVDSATRVSICRLSAHGGRDGLADGLRGDEGILMYTGSSVKAYQWRPGSITIAVV